MHPNTEALPPLYIAPHIFWLLAAPATAPWVPWPVYKTNQQQTPILLYLSDLPLDSRRDRTVNHRPRVADNRSLACREPSSHSKWKSQGSRTSSEKGSHRKSTGPAGVPTPTCRGCLPSLLCSWHLSGKRPLTQGCHALSLSVASLSAAPPGTHPGLRSPRRPQSRQPAAASAAAPGPAARLGRRLEAALGAVPCECDAHVSPEPLEIVADGDAVDQDLQGHKKDRKRGGGGHALAVAMPAPQCSHRQPCPVLTGSSFFLPAEPTASWTHSAQAVPWAASPPRPPTPLQL